MQFTEKTLKTLEYDKIIEMLAEVCATEGARARAYALMPSDDADTVRERQQRTDDAKRLIAAKGYPSFFAPESVVPAADRAYKGATLSPRELLDVAALLRCAAGLCDYVEINIPFETVLEPIFRRMLPNRELERRITRAILSEELIADEASPTLADIRRKIRNTNNKIKDTLSGYVGGAKIKYLQENIVTMRNGRYVIPVKAEYRSEIKGLVHDTSSTGATLFVEPMAVVEANNELKTLAAEETHEIERILSAFSAEVAEFQGAIAANYHNITDLAFCFALATLATNMRANMPNIKSEQIIQLRRARHPLIPKERVVPIDVSVGGEYDTLIITGPNTGGKTVTLKTLGLFALMAQSGMQIPVAEGSSLGVFSEILVDIGDDSFSMVQRHETEKEHFARVY